MGAGIPEDDAPITDDDERIAGVAELLRRERPTPTFDELGRLDRRLIAARTPRRARHHRARNWWSRLAVMACLSVGALFTTAGSGLALSGMPGQAGFTAMTPNPVSATAHAQAGAHRPGSSRSRQTTSGAASTEYISLIRAETDNELPFTGFAAIPVLLGGLLLIAAGAVIHGRTGTPTGD